MVRERDRKSPRVLIVSQNQVIVEGFGAIFQRYRWQVSVCADMAAVDSPASQNLVVIDINPQTRIDGAWLKRLSRWGKSVPIIVFGRNADFERVRADAKCGTLQTITGFESLSEIMDIAQKAARSGHGAESSTGVSEPTRNQAVTLTIREREIYRLLSRGKRNGQIARELGISVKTVETHKEHLKQKLDLKSTAELLESAIRDCG